MNGRSSPTPGEIRARAFVPRTILFLGIALVILGSAAALAGHLGQGLVIAGLGASSAFFGGLLYYQVTVLDRDVPGR